MELIQATVDTVAAKRLPWREVLVLPVGDLQLGAPGADLDRFKRHIQWGIEHDAYFLGVGGFADLSPPS